MPQPNKPPEVLEQARDLYRQGHNTRHIAQLLGLGVGTLYDHVTEADKVTRKAAEVANREKAKVAFGVGPVPIPKPGKVVGLPAAKHEAKEDDAAFPDPIFEVFERFHVDNAGQWLVISDIHIPYHDRATVEIAVAEAKRRGVVGVILNGDILDTHELSDHDRDPRAVRYADEIGMGKQFFAWLRKQLPKARFVYKEGNHEFRLIRYLMRKAPAFFGIEAVSTHALLGLADVGVEWVADNRIVSLGRLNVIHGHEYKGGVSSPVNPARGLYLKARSVAMAGHHHQTSEHHTRDIRGKAEAAWSLGCACFLSPGYMRFNHWNHGFAFVTLDESGEFMVENKRVMGGKIV